MAATTGLFLGHVVWYHIKKSIQRQGRFKFMASDTAQGSTVLTSLVTELVRPLLAVIAIAVSVAGAAAAWVSVLSETTIRVQTASEVRRRRGRI
jgi:hypothetical protein